MSTRFGADDPLTAEAAGLPPRSGRTPRAQAAYERAERVGRWIGRLIVLALLVSLGVVLVALAHLALQLAAWAWGWS